MAAGLLGGDGLLARSSIGAGPVGQSLRMLVTFADLLAGKQISPFLLGFGLLLAGAAATSLRSRGVARALLYVGAVQLSATVVADFAKPVFGRLRPFQALTDHGWIDRWFMGADFGSFPSGHVAFYAGLFLPLAMLFPRAAPLLVLPLLVGAERILSHDHYPSDVGVSLLLAALTAALFRPLLAQGMRGDIQAPASSSTPAGDLL